MAGAFSYGQALQFKASTPAGEAARHYQMRGPSSHPHVVTCLADDSMSRSCFLSQRHTSSPKVDVYVTRPLPQRAKEGKLILVCAVFIQCLVHSVSQSLLRGRRYHRATVYKACQGIGHANPLGLERYSLLAKRYFAYSTRRVSRMTCTLICPGYCMSVSMRLAISRAS